MLHLTEIQFFFNLKTIGGRKEGGEKCMSWLHPVYKDQVVEPIKAVVEEEAGREQETAIAIDF